MFLWTNSRVAGDMRRHNDHLTSIYMWPAGWNFPIRAPATVHKPGQIRWWFLTSMEEFKGKVVLVTGEFSLTLSLGCTTNDSKSDMTCSYFVLISVMPYREPTHCMWCEVRTGLGCQRGLAPVSCMTDWIYRACILGLKRQKHVDRVWNK